MRMAKLKALNDWRWESQTCDHEFACGKAKDRLAGSCLRFYWPYGGLLLGQFYCLLYGDSWRWFFCKEQPCLENTRASNRSSWTTNSLHHSLTVEALHRFAKTFRLVRTTHLYCVALLQTINFQTISSESIQWRCASELSTDSHHLLVLNSYRFLPASVLNIYRFLPVPISSTGR